MADNPQIPTTLRSSTTSWGTMRSESEDVSSDSFDARLSLRLERIARPRKRKTRLTAARPRVQFWASPRKTQKEK